MSSEAIEVQPLSSTIGAEIRGIHMSKPLDEHSAAVIRQALLDWKVIFFRDQDVSTDEHIDFSRNFGELEVHPFGKNKEGYPEVLLIENGPNNKSYINFWHSDVTWRLEPSLGSLLRAIEVPSLGGDTMFANMEAAYDGLQDELKERIDGLVATHDFMATFGRGLNEEERVNMRKKYPIAEHPVVRTHPETGRKSLYVNAAFTSGIKGMPDREAFLLLNQLYQTAGIPEHQVRFQWRKNSVAFWDNRAAQHYPISDYFPAVRRMERVTVVGSKPH
jgi:taurine dioxygenase